ncbi:MAG: hypothetical protein ACYTG0_07620 [Planctomycetota bacterium]|jgi:hypothetical protein
MQMIELIGEQQLRIDASSNGQLLTFVGQHGEVRLAIEVTAEGPVLRLEDSGLTIQTGGDLRIAAEHVAIHGRSGVDLTTDGELRFEADGELHSAARAQNLTAERGNVNIKANDDVKLNGERIKLNC